MSENLGNLHLPDLSIRNFRGIRSLDIGRLGRVTLVGGRNGIGKTTVLDAVRVYAAGGRPRTLDGMLDQRDDTRVSFNANQFASTFQDYTSLFSGWSPTINQSITIGPKSNPTELMIQSWPYEALTADQQNRFFDVLMTEDCHFLKIRFRDRETLVASIPDEFRSLAVEQRSYHALPRRRTRFEGERLETLSCQSLGPGTPKGSTLAEFWDHVTLTPYEDDSLRALRLANRDIERVAVIADNEAENGRRGRRVIVKLEGVPSPIPIRSLGDGTMRLFATALALANSRGGFLVIDEAENGLHYSLHRDYWQMVLRASSMHNVQVFATTHSRDCVAGFARALEESEDIEGAYVRLSRCGGHLHAVEYSEEELKVVAEQDIEVR